MAPQPIFKNQSFALSGTFAHARKEYEDLIQKHGGAITASVTKTTNFLISTEADVKALTTKVATAQGRGLPILKESFISECIAAKTLLDPADYSVKGTSKKRRAAAGAKAPAGKREKTDLRVEVSVTAVVIKKPEDDVGVLQEQMSKDFVKASLTWDVELVLHDVVKGRDRFYNMQLVATKKHPHSFWVVQNWGRTGLEGRFKIDGPFDTLSSAKKAFMKKYRSKTGNVWGQLGATFIESAGKYRLLAKSDEKEEKARGYGRWQFYQHNELDGKKIGWQEYHVDASKNLEKYWHQLGNNPELAVRIVSTDYFTYEVNFIEMLQTNMKTGTRRVIRRIPEGGKSSSDAPAKIPDPVKPRAIVPPTEEEEEEEGRADDCEDEEEDDEAADAADVADAEAETDAEAMPLISKDAEESDDVAPRVAPDGSDAATRVQARSQPSNTPSRADVVDAD